MPYFQFVVKETVEEHMLELQRQKRELMGYAFGNDKFVEREQRIKDIQMLMS